MPHPLSPAFARARRRAERRLAALAHAAAVGGIALAALAPPAQAQSAARSALPTFAPRVLLAQVDLDTVAPAVADLDGDGDLDLLVGRWAYYGDGFRYFENTTTPGGPTAFAAPVGDPFGLAAMPLSERRIPAFADLDGDGDLDLAVGTGGTDYANAVYVFENTGTAAAPAFGTPASVIVADDAAPTFADTDGDGDPDLLLGSTTAGTGALALYPNLSTAGVIAFGPAQPAPFGLGAVDARVAPHLTDLDADGDPDLLTGDLTGIDGYTNTAAPGAAPQFAAPVPAPGGLSTPGSVPRVATGDLDGDGDLDALAGDLNGRVYLFDGTGLVTSADFGPPQTLAGFADVGNRSSPALADLDRDGDLDVFVGSSAGTWVYFENIGTPAAPAFDVEPRPFGLSLLGTGSFDIAHAFGDLDGDGDTDAIAGDSQGWLWFERDTAPAGAASPAFQNQGAQLLGLTDVGDAATPTLGDADGDGDLDLLVGTATGDFRYFENTAGPAALAAFDPAVTNPFGLTAVGANAAPRWLDSDGDGDLDVLAGESNGALTLFENTAGPGAVPSFAAAQVHPDGLASQAGRGGRARLAAGDLDADGDLDLVIGALDGELRYVEDRGIAATTRTAVLDGPAGWRMIAAPTATEPFNDVLGDAVWTQGQPGADAPGGTPTVFVYDETVPGDENLGYVAPDLGAPLPLGTGAFVYVFEDADPGTPGTQSPFPKTISARGVAPSHTFRWAGANAAGGGDAPLSYTPSAAFADDGWNLLGNPFGSWFDWDATSRSSVNQPLYAYDPGIASYRIATGFLAGADTLPGGVVGPFQAFWVQIDDAAGAIMARAGVASGGALAKDDAAPALVRLRLRPADGSALPARLESVASLALGVAEATDGLDRYDARLLVPPADAFVALGTAGEVPLAVDARPETGAETTVELTVQAVGAAGAQPMRLDWPGLDLPDGWTVRLLDREAGTSTVLAADGSYPFTLAAEAARAPLASPAHRPEAAASRTEGRFALVVTPAGVVSGEDAPATATLSGAMPNPARGTARLALTLASPERVRAAVYDALGREVAVVADGELTGAVELRVDTARLAAGVYVVRVGGETFAETRRLTVVR